MTTVNKSVVLQGLNLVLFWAGLIFLALAGLGLITLLIIVQGHFYGDYLTFGGAIEAVGTVLGSAATTFAAIGSALLFVVSLRVQASELQHSIEELKNSVEAQKDAAQSHKANLLLAKQEKEFNTCLSAIEQVQREILEITWQQLRGVHAIRGTIDDWVRLVADTGLRRAASAKHPLFMTLNNIDEVFHKFDDVDNLNIHMYWALHAVERKDLDENDRRYLRSLIYPIVKEVGRSQTGIATLLERLSTVASMGDETLRLLGVNRDVWRVYIQHVQALYDRCKPASMEAEL